MKADRFSPTEASLTGLRVLVVEDDYFIADEMCTSLREHGAEIVRALLQAVQSACNSAPAARSVQEC